MRRWWARWVAAVHVEEPVLGLALFRIAIGLTVAWTLTRIVALGSMEALWFPQDEGGILPLTGDWRWRLVGGASARATVGVTALAFGGALLVAAGVGTRLAAFLCGQALIALFSLVPETGGGHDRLLTNALWLLVFAPSDHSLSLECRWRTGRWVDAAPRADVVRWLAILQICVVYGVTGWQKMGPEWWPWGGYAAVYRSVLIPDWSRFDLAPVLGHAYPLTQLGTAVTMAWECTFPLVGLWYWGRHRRPGWQRWDLRVPYFVVGLVMHGTLEVLMNLGPFAWSTLAFYLCFFDAEDWRRITRRPYS